MLLSSVFLNLGISVIIVYSVFLVQCLHGKSILEISEQLEREGKQSVRTDSKTNTRAMEFYSPQPEHAQLNTTVTPKNSSHLLGLLHQQVMQATRPDTDNGVMTNRNGSSSGGSNSIDATNVSSASSSVPHSASVADRDLNGNGNGNGNGSTIDGIIASNYYPEQGIDAILDEHLIPSPPLSPELEVSIVDDKEYLEPLDLNKGQEQQQQQKSEANGIVVKPSWQAGLSVKRYRYATHGFLSEYRIFQNLKNSNAINKQAKYAGGNIAQNRNLRKSKGFKPSSSDIERIYRTRRIARKQQTANYLSDDDIENFSPFELKRPSTPVRRPKKALPALSSPLASANAVHSIPQYVPNMSWEKLPDYSPPLSTLPESNVKCLKVEWKGSQMDLSHDPLKSKLHPSELILAQILRLPCDLYLDSKRRLFLEKTHRLKQGLPFRRTDAQKACRIDVNKASRLYAAFEKVGWLDDSNFARFL